MVKNVFAELAEEITDYWIPKGFEFCANVSLLNIRDQSSLITVLLSNV